MRAATRHREDHSSATLWRGPLAAPRAWAMARLRPSARVGQVATHQPTSDRRDERRGPRQEWPHLTMDRIRHPTRARARRFHRVGHRCPTDHSALKLHRHRTAVLPRRDPAVDETLSPTEQSACYERGAKRRDAWRRLADFEYVLLPRGDVRKVDQDGPHIRRWPLDPKRLSEGVHSPSVGHPRPFERTPGRVRFVGRPWPRPDASRR